MFSAQCDSDIELDNMGTRSGTSSCYLALLCNSFPLEKQLVFEHNMCFFFTFNSEVKKHAAGCKNSRLDYPFTLRAVPLALLTARSHLPRMLGVNTESFLTGNASPAPSIHFALSTAQIGGASLFCCYAAAGGFPFGCYGARVPVSADMGIRFDTLFAHVY